jgi:hypothetical protein
MAQAADQVLQALSLQSFRSLMHPAETHRFVSVFAPLHGIPHSLFCLVIDLVLIQIPVHPPPGYQSAQSANKQSIGTQPWQSGRPGQSPNSVMVPWQVFWLATSHIPEGVVVNVLENGGGVGYGVAGGGVGYGVVGAT